MKIGRNDDCPCGSGKKYKHCCLRKAAPPAAGGASLTQAVAPAPPAPRTPADHYLLGLAARNEGRMDRAFNSFLRALQSGGDAPSMKAEFARCVRHIQFTQAPRDFRLLMSRAIREGWARPGDLLGTARSLILLDDGIRLCVERAARAWPLRLAREDLFGASGFEAVTGDPLLRSLLENVAIDSVEFERYLTMARSLLLESGLATGADAASAGDNAEYFYCALARQCFVNEYIFARTPEELARAETLRDLLVSRLSATSQVPAVWLAAVAAYFPLESVPGAERLLHDAALSDGVKALLTQQIREPAAERKFRAGVQRLSSADDPTSRRVQEQYEENPYPRWTRSAIVTDATSLNDFVRRRFPDAPFQVMRRQDGADILIAGCGTGQQSIETAQQYRGAQVAAIDISLKSLGYAIRKTRELGLTNINYAQADLLNLQALDRTFDLIEVLGVLHHLSDPLAGWRALLDKLKPGGLMRIALYSELARTSVVAGRTLIAQMGFAATADGIRDCRQVMMAPERAPQFAPLLSSPDFFGMSTCRDLLFHVQEHRYTALQLKDMLQSLQLSLIGFDVDPTILGRYLQRFPGDRAATNLENWHAFEIDAPETFAGMYQFWVQKPLAA